MFTSNEYVDSTDLTTETTPTGSTTLHPDEVYGENETNRYGPYTSTKG